MTLFPFRLSVGVAIFIGLLFCGWWTYSMVTEDLSAGVGTHESKEQRDQLRDELVAEWSWPVVVYLVVLALMVAAIADEVRQVVKYRAGRADSDRDGLR